MCEIYTYVPTYVCVRERELPYSTACQGLKHSENTNNLQFSVWKRPVKKFSSARIKITSIRPRSWSTASTSAMLNKSAYPSNLTKNNHTEDIHAQTYFSLQLKLDMSKFINDSDFFSLMNLITTMLSSAWYMYFKKASRAGSAKTAKKTATCTLLPYKRLRNNTVIPSRSADDAT